jgi:essential nuclear protein 1
MPVLWHQTLLVFAQRYKEDLEEDQIISIKHLLSCQRHPVITAEIEFELGSAQIKH